MKSTITFIFTITLPTKLLPSLNSFTIAFRDELYGKTDIKLFLDGSQHNNLRYRFYSVHGLDNSYIYE